MAPNTISFRVRLAGVAAALALLAVACSGDTDDSADPAPPQGGGTADVDTGASGGDDDGDDPAGDGSTAAPAASANGGILDDRQCGPEVDEVLFFGRGGDDLVALSATGEVLWTVQGVESVEQDPQGLDWSILRNGEVFDFATGSIERNGDLTNPGGVLPDCRVAYLVPPNSLLGHDGTFAWQADESIYVPGSYQGSDEGILVFAREVDEDEDFAPDGVPVDNLMGLNGDGSVAWSHTAKGTLRYENGVIGIGDGAGIESTVWFDGATGDELFSTEAVFNQVVSCGQTVWFHVRGSDGFGLEVRSTQTGELLFENDQVVEVGVGYDGYGDDSYFGEGTSAGYQIDDQFTFVPDCSNPAEPAWTATARVDDEIVITDDVVYIPGSRTLIDRTSGDVLIDQTDERGAHSTGNAIVGGADRDGSFGLGFFDPRTFEELAFVPGSESFSALRVPSWADPAVLRLNMADGSSRVIDARTGESLGEFQ